MLRCENLHQVSSDAVINPRPPTPSHVSINVLLIFRFGPELFEDHGSSDSINEGAFGGTNKADAFIVSSFIDVAQFL